MEIYRFLYPRLLMQRLLIHRMKEAKAPVELLELETKIEVALFDTCLLVDTQIKEKKGDEKEK